MGFEISRKQGLRGSRRQGAADNDSPVSNADQPQKQSAERGGQHPLIPVEFGPIVAAVLTAAASLLFYSFNQIKEIDGRLDKLEQAGRILIDGQGGIRPSKEALQNYFHIEAILRRIDRMEQKL